MQALAHLHSSVVSIYITEVIKLQDQAAGIRSIDAGAATHMNKRSHPLTTALAFFALFLPV
ncbi:hypothetical protein ES703_56534 [subsurface metagenome]